MFLEFEEWKDKTEEEHVCNYARRTGVKGNVEYYQCNRGGVYVPSGTGKRRTKSQGITWLKLKANLLINHRLSNFF